MSKYTAGPWVTSAVNRCEILACGTGAARVARALDEFDDNPGGPKAFSESYANARLISAAPDLLAACKLFVRFAENGKHPGWASYLQTRAGFFLRAAIDKAEGGKA